MRADFQVAIVYNIEEKLVRGELQDLLAIQYTANTTHSLFGALTQLGYSTRLVGVKDSLEDLRQELGQLSPRSTFIFNNCDGFVGDNLAAARVIHLIEDLGFSHTGSTADVVELCTDKVRAKDTLLAAGIPTPAYQVFTRPGGRRRVNFPAIVKPQTEDASMGIDLESVVADETNLQERIAFVIEHYQQPAMVEEFIPGREFAISMWGNGEDIEALPVSEEDYSLIPDPLQRLLTFEAKWFPTSYYYQNIFLRCPALLAAEEARLVVNTAVRAYRLLGLRDFGRVDMRYEHGIPYVIDVNELPDLAPDAGFAHAAGCAGYAYPQVVEKILTLAICRENWR